ncbi:hypothetical protein L2E82_43553 [Cichorium intybus]|uniref:Uncharacterized protein n=1 Tax=Cichorium intybus TaxID=13427 RepID=A0ACB8ZNS2_CICIN|nr:hypothetical protein L2E82_43553 [Cichorium intybus]
MRSKYTEDDGGNQLLEVCGSVGQLEYSGGTSNSSVVNVEISTGVCLVDAKNSNPENTIGVLTMAGKGVRVLVTPTSSPRRLIETTACRLP